MSDFTIKDSGERQQFASGMVRDVQADKTLYSLVLDGPMFERWAVHLTKGARKYAARNWMKAAGTEELDRFRESALRHFIQWYRGEADEDHAAAVVFNINGAEYVKGKLTPPQFLRSGVEINLKPGGVTPFETQEDFARIEAAVRKMHEAGANVWDTRGNR